MNEWVKNLTTILIAITIFVFLEQILIFKSWKSLDAMCTAFQEKKAKAQVNHSNE